MDKNVSALTLGIRHRRSFGITDRVGQIIDYVLHDEKSPFDTDFFPNTYETVRNGRLLANPATNESLAIDADNVVLRIRVKNFEEDLKRLQGEYLGFIRDGIFQSFDIENINRIGIVFEHSFDKSVISLEKAIQSLTKREVEALADIQLRFSKKLPADEAQYKKGVVDFYNAIYTFTKDDSEFLAMLDFQMYLEPEIAVLADVPFDAFFTRAANYLHTKFQPSLTYEEVQTK